jgi:hypothetical protein
LNDEIQWLREALWSKTWTIWAFIIVIIIAVILLFFIK